MAEAKRAGGLFYTADGKAVDANGDEIKGAPKQPKDTSPEEMQRTVQAKDPIQRLADTLDRQFGGSAYAASMASQATPKSPTATADDGGEIDSEVEEGLPALGEMEAYLATITDADELKALRRKDRRKGAKPMYAARLKEIESE